MPCVQLLLLFFLRNNLLAHTHSHTHSGKVIVCHARNVSPLCERSLSLLCVCVCRSPSLATFIEQMKHRWLNFLLNGALLTCHLRESTLLCMQSSNRINTTAVYISCRLYSTFIHCFLSLSLSLAVSGCFGLFLLLHRPSITECVCTPCFLLLYPCVHSSN